MKVTLVHQNGWTAVYIGEGLVEEGYLSMGDMLKLLVGKGCILDVEDHFVDIEEDFPKTLTEFYKIKEEL